MKLQIVIRDAAIGEPADAGQHIYCGHCGFSVYDVAGSLAVQCTRCDGWTRVGPVLVRPAELHAAARMQTPTQRRAVARRRGSR